MVKNPPANAGDMGLIPDLGRSHMPWRTKLMCHSYEALRLREAPAVRSNQRAVSTRHSERKPSRSSKTRCGQKKQTYKNLKNTFI